MNSSVSKEMLATYRLQLGPDLTFERVCDLLPYFRDLGISHLYLSPCLKSAAGSTHGYDVVDPSEVNPQLGGREGFERLCRASAEFGIGLVLDIVPNHMAISGRQNPWWWDVLVNGRDSRHVEVFDIRWDHPDPVLAGKVLLPVLGDALDRCLEARQIRIQRCGTEICLTYFEHEFPISTCSLSVLQHAGSKVPELDASIAAINADPVRLKGFLELQHYRLAFWRRANRDLNYRRFFDIHHLAGVCVEKEAVFAATHELVLRWVNNGWIDGLRIDHPDGLRDPTTYLKRLRAAAPLIWVVVEKILEPGETLSSEWPVAGTTGYDFLNLTGGLFVDPRSKKRLTDFYGEFTGQSTDYEEVLHEKKRLVLELLFGSELSHLESLLTGIRSRHPVAIEFPPEDVGRALTEVIACFPVYRTYIQPDTCNVGPRDLAVVREAFSAALRRQPDIDTGCVAVYRGHSAVEASRKNRK